MLLEEFEWFGYRKDIFSQQWRQAVIDAISEEDNDCLSLSFPAFHWGEDELKVHRFSPLLAPF